MPAVPHRGPDGAAKSGRALHLDDANRWGQQLFLANMALQRRPDPRANPTPAVHASPRRRRRTGRRPANSSRWSTSPTTRIVRERALVADSDLIAYCRGVIRDHAARHGWSKRQANDVIRSLRMIQVLQDTPTAKVNATDVLALSRYHGNVSSTIDVLAAAGLLIDDRVSHIERYFADKTDQLPEPMKAQLEVCSRSCSTEPTRRLAAAPRSSDHPVHILGITPILQAWAEAGHQSLAEFTPAMVLAALPAARRDTTSPSTDSGRCSPCSKATSSSSPTPPPRCAPRR